MSEVKGRACGRCSAGGVEDLVAGGRQRALQRAAQHGVFVYVADHEARPGRGQLLQLGLDQGAQRFAARGERGCR